MKFTHTEKRSLLLFLMLVLAFLVIFPFILPVYHSLESILRSSPLLGPLLYILLMIGAILIAPIPASPLAVLAGNIFGPFMGMIYTLFAGTLGALAAFVIARFLFGEVTHNHLKSYAWYKKIVHADERQIALMIGISRLMPQISFDIVSYAAGLTKIRASLFALVTCLGMIPIVFVLSFFGYLLEPYKDFAVLILAVLFVVYCAYKFLHVSIASKKDKTKK